MEYIIKAVIPATIVKEYIVEANSIEEILDTLYNNIDKLEYVETITIHDENICYDYPKLKI